MLAEDVVEDTEKMEVVDWAAVSTAPVARRKVVRCMMGQGLRSVDVLSTGLSLQPEDINEQAGRSKLL